MTAHRETRHLPYDADLMFRVVADIERYPEFLPWVLALRVKSRSVEEGREVLIAEMAVGYGALRERYTSRVTIDPAVRSIDVVEIAGPFKRLENHWRFTPAEGGCEVDFAIAFEFHNRLLQLTAGKAFEQVLLKMTDAFAARAKAMAQDSKKD